MIEFPIWAIVIMGVGDIPALILIISIILDVIDEWRWRR